VAQTANQDRMEEVYHGGKKNTKGKKAIRNHQEKKEGEREDERLKKSRLHGGRRKRTPHIWQGTKKKKCTGAKALESKHKQRRGKRGWEKGKGGVTGARGGDSMLAGGAHQRSSFAMRLGVKGGDIEYRRGIGMGGGVRGVGGEPGLVTA